jgi:polysaccharide biosynthesis transport protein
MSITPPNDDGLKHANGSSVNGSSVNGNGQGGGRDFLAELQARAMIESDSSEDDGGSVDFLGPMMRRKSIIILLSLMGALIGYLMYRREIPVYASSLRLMLWTQMPPVIANGEPVTPAVSIPKQQALITSQTILDRAIRKGKLDELETFKNNPFPVGLLKGMISVRPVASQTDALELSCRGKNAEDLPKILDAVLGAYREFLDDSTKTMGAESTQLLEDLLEKTSTQRRLDQVRFNELQNELRITGDDLLAQTANPYADRLRFVESEKANKNRALGEVRSRVNEVTAAEGKVNLEERTLAMRVIAMKAEKFMMFGSNTNSSDVSERVDMVRRTQAKIEDADQRISVLEQSISEWTRNFSDNHPTILLARGRLQTFQKEKLRLETALKEIKESEDRQKEEKKLQDPQKTGQLTESQALNVLLYKIALESEFNSLRSDLETLDQEYNDLAQNEAANRQKIAEFNFLRTKIAQKETKDDQLVDRLTAISVSTGYNTTRVEEIDRPLQGAKVAPNLTTYMIFSMVLGALIGTALAVLVDRADMAFRNPYEIFQKMKVPVLCKVPNIVKSKVKTDLPCGPTLITAIDPRSSAAEAFRSCRTAMLFFANHSGAKTFLLSSPSAGDGKSTTVSNLAVSLSQSGKRVCLLDCDLRRPRQHQHFGVSLKPGLIDVESGKSTIDEAIRPTFLENLSIVTSGGHPENPGEFVVSPKFREILAELRNRFDVVLIDSPPLLPVADATSLSTQVDGTLLVFRIRKGVVLASTKARELLDLVHAKVLGVIVNGVDQNPYYSEYGGYNYSGYSGYTYAADRYYERQIKEYADTVDES